MLGNPAWLIQYASIQMPQSWSHRFKLYPMSELNQYNVWYCGFYWYWNVSISPDPWRSLSLHGKLPMPSPSLPTTHHSAFQSEHIQWNPGPHRQPIWPYCPQHQSVSLKRPLPHSYAHSQSIVLSWRSPSWSAVEWGGGTLPGNGHQSRPLPSLYSALPTWRHGLWRLLYVAGAACQVLYTRRYRSAVSSSKMD